ncbi:MAG: hypothetical protein COS08_05590 [Euryarchaeota archaeon CG01_land_8_20_14_3_00_38_12]|nr:MAG: hypothetical protein COS08_05590 [Euryarchaeota archaeon CG01_land_8_20_14_3_00_38_12]PJB21301.1 MAG: hypothetical protein CO114_06070 [Euryarchaeota archaeon CG_4_9_14_3_um_filter_38_12]
MVEAVELEPLIQQKKPLSAALAVVIVLVILLPSVILSMVLYLWVSGFMSMGEGEVGVEVVGGGTQALAMSEWSKTTGTTASASVVSTIPSSGIEWSDITWYLCNASTGVVDTGAVFSYTDGDNDDYLEAGDTVTVIASSSGTCRVRAIVNGSVIYQSTEFTL